MWLETHARTHARMHARTHARTHARITLYSTDLHHVVLCQVWPHWSSPHLLEWPTVRRVYGCSLLACVHLSGSVHSVWVWPTVWVSSTCLCSSVRISGQCVGVTYCKGVLYLLVFICQDQWTVCGCDLLYGCPLLACVHLSGPVDSVWVWPTVWVSSTCLCSSVRISGQCVGVTYCKGVLYLLVFIYQDQWAVCECDLL